MSFIVYDIGLLVAFLIGVSIFLYTKRKNLKREGLFFLYRAKWGIKLIDYVGKKYKKTLNVLSYVSVGLGYVLMISIFYLVIRTVYLYITTPIAQEIKAPPVAPLIPYFPTLFGLDSYFPVFYFVYFIAAILIVATVHEFAHGIFARRYNIKIKSTGFAFFKYLPAFFGAFVEQDEKQMTKAKKFEQKSVLSAGVFANTLIALIFFIIIIFYFNCAFSPVGVGFIDYSYEVVDLASISMINNITLTNPSYEKIIELTNETSIDEVYVGEKKFVGIRAISEESERIALYHDAPAINVKLNKVITKINGVKIENGDDLRDELKKYSPGDKIEITTIGDSREISQEIVLSKNPSDENLPYLGIISTADQNIFLKEFGHYMNSLRQENLYFKGSTFYEPKSQGFSEFIFYLIWWIVMINILVALFNMLPVGFLDGGRFFYLTVLEITKSENKAKKAFSLVTYFLLSLVIVLMVIWASNFIM